MATYARGETRDLYCDVCGTMESVEQPMDVPRFVKQAQAFIELHKGCVEFAGRLTVNGASDICPECRMDLTAPGSEHIAGCSRDPRPSMRGETKREEKREKESHGN